MKVLSLKEPYATLILKGHKKIETRSWKTNYRGELYIHASKTKEMKYSKELENLLQNSSLNNGYIICKCNLTDCIYMTEEYIEKIKKENPKEYLCGEYKVGRYAWVLDDVTPMNPKIKAKGQLNIWNFYNEFEIMDFMNEIEYGWIDQNLNKHSLVNERFSENYRLQTPKEVMKNKIGICWDQVELERYYFKGYDGNIKTYFLVYYDDKNCPSHTFLTFEKNNKIYWFEHSYKEFRGIHEYDSLKELLNDAKNKFILDQLPKNYNKEKLVIHEYQKPLSHLKVIDFYKHCDEGPFIDIEKL